MSADTYGSKGQPQFASSGAPAIDVDPSAVADYAALLGNHVVGTTTQRNANVIPNASGQAVWAGLYWSDTTDGNTYKRVASAWQLVIGDTGWSTLTLTGTGWTSAGDGTYATGKIRVKNGRVLIRGIFSKTSWAAFDTITTLVAAFRPTDAVTLTCRIGAGTPGTARVLASGSVQVEIAGAGFIVIDAGWELA